MRYDFFQHMTSGDVFAAQWDGRDTIVALAGPLYHGDIHPANLPTYAYTTEDAAWANAAPLCLLSTTEVLQKWSDIQPIY